MAAGDSFATFTPTSKSQIQEKTFKLYYKIFVSRMRKAQTMIILNDSEFNPLNTLLETLNITETELQLSNQEDFVNSFKNRLLKEFTKKCIEILIPLIKQKVNKIALKGLAEINLEQALDEAIDETYSRLIKEIKNMTLPESIIEAWQEAKKKSTQKDPKPTTHPRLFLNRSVEPLPSAAVMMSSVNSQLKPDKWQKDTNNTAFYEHLGKQSGQIIEHYISQSSGVGDITILPWEEAWQIIEKFNFITAKLHLLFAAHCIKQEKPWESKFTLKASDIIKEIGWDKRTDIPNHELLKEIASAAYTLDCLTVRAEWEVGQPNKKGKIPIIIDISRLWTISFQYRGEKDIYNHKIDDPTEIYITVRPGLWTDSFLNQAGYAAKKALYQFGYIAQEVFKIDPYHDELALRLAIHITLESRYHTAGRYKVETLLRNILLGAEAKIQEAREDKLKGQRLKHQWKNALKLLETLGWQIIYDSETYPSYLQHLSREQCPKGYFDKLLGATLTIRPPDPIPTLISKVEKNNPTPTKVKKQPPQRTKAKSTPLTPQDIREARKSKKWNQKELAEFMGVSQQLISLIERGNHTPTEKQEKELRKLLEID
jgi:DNA-binding XRE family transcriptional regulator